jgi:hypothetical protein
VSGYAESIRKRFRLNEQIETFEFGLGASTRDETIYLRGAGSSTFGKKADAETIRIVDVADWFAERAAAPRSR